MPQLCLWHQPRPLLTLVAAALPAAPAAHSPEYAACAGKVLDLLPHDVDASVVRGVELQGHVLHGAAVHLPGNRQDCGCFARARRSVEEQVGQAVLLCELLDCGRTSSCRLRPRPTSPQPECGTDAGSCPSHLCQ